ncbi:MAG: NADP-dependent isocitrate dehydrogenase [Rhodanobacter sp.]
MVAVPTSLNIPSPAAAVDHIAVAPGDGIGPEITDAVLLVLRAAVPDLRTEHVEIGERAYMRGAATGIDNAAWSAITGLPVLLKGPITTPQGGGYKSVNVTLRKALGLYANVRPCKSYHPFVRSLHPRMDVVIVRENEEDTYGGIEHRQTAEVYQCLKLITRPGCERIVRYAFEYARAYGRRKVSCFTKDNIMKLTDGLFHKVFEQIAIEYPEMAHEHLIVDIGSARLATRPEDFDVIVTPNLYGDILSDIAAEMTGSIGLAGSANVGMALGMFEAVHGSAPMIAGRDLANPSGLLNAAVMMLTHMGRGEAAEAIHNAWLRTLEDGLHTADIFSESSRKQVGTRRFAIEVIDRLGSRPRKLAPVELAARPPLRLPQHDAPIERPAKRLVGVDVFLDWDCEERDPKRLGQMVGALAGPEFRLTLITNRGVKVYPDGMPQTLCTDHWRCRFVARAANDYGEIATRVLALLRRLLDAGFDTIKTENLYEFDGQRGYSQGQGE